MAGDERTERGVRAVVPVVMIAVATVVAIVPVLGDDPVRNAVGVLCLGVAIVYAYTLRSAPAVRACAVLGALLLLLAAARLLDLLPAPVTVLSCAVPVVVLAVCNRYAWLRPAMPWLRLGRISRGMIAFGVLTVGLTGVALVLWTLIVEPETPAYLGDLQERPLWVGLAGIVAFALVNPIWEELIFRGVVQHELAQVWGLRAAVVGQALLFGAAHWAGFPSGWSGSVMAAGWGFALGVIRVRTGGMLLPYAVHAGADATIGTLALLVL